MVVVVVGNLLVRVMNYDLTHRHCYCCFAGARYYWDPLAMLELGYRLVETLMESSSALLRTL